MRKPCKFLTLEQDNMGILGWAAKQQSAGSSNGTVEFQNPTSLNDSETPVCITLYMYKQTLLYAILLLTEIDGYLAPLTCRPRANNVTLHDSAKPSYVVGPQGYQLVREATYRMLQQGYL